MLPRSGKRFYSHFSPFPFPSLSIKLLLLFLQFTAGMMGLNSFTLRSRKFRLCSEASSAEAPFTLIFQHGTKTFGKLVFFLGRAFCCCPGLLRDSPWTASTFEPAHWRKYFPLNLPSHIITSAASLSYLHQLPHLLGFAPLCFKGSFSCWSLELLEDGWSWSSTGSSGLTGPPQRRRFCRLQRAIPSAKHQRFHS